MSASSSTNNISVNGVFKSDGSGASSIAAYTKIFCSLQASANPFFNFVGYQGGSYQPFISLTSGVTATCNLDEVVTKAGGYIYRAGGTDVAVVDGGTGLSTTPTDGQLLIGKTSTNNYALATLTQGTGITITNGSGSITVAATTTPMTWSSKSEDFTPAGNNGYVITGSSDVIANLPSTYAVGDTFTFTCNGTAGLKLKIAPNSGDYIYMGNVSIASGETLNSGDLYNAITLVCLVANSTWIVTKCIGNFEIT